MSTTSLRRGILLAAIVPALLTAGCAAGGTGQAMKGAASPPTTPPDTSTGTGGPTDVSPPPTDTMSPSPSGTMSPTGGADAAAPRAVVEEFYSAMADGNTDKAVKLFTPDAVAAVDGEPTAEGAEGLRSLIQGEEDSDGSPTIEEATAVESWAFVRATKGEGADETRAFFVLSKENGNWKIDRYMTNSAS
jgi:ketosteroid isomerase-like protein